MGIKVTDYLNTEESDQPSREINIACPVKTRLESVLKNFDYENPLRNKVKILQSDLASFKLHPWRESDIDPVLLVVLKSSANQEVTTHVWEKAFQSLVGSFKDYTEIFGSLLPEQFAKEAGHRVEIEAYRNNEAAVASEDWGIFEEILRSSPNGVSKPGMTTGLPSLDEAMNGLSGFGVLGADEGVGKSTLALSFAFHSLQQCDQTAALYYSLDMEKSRLYLRLLSMQAEKSIRDLKSMFRSGIDDEIRDARERLQADALKRLRVIERRKYHREIRLENNDVDHAEIGLTSAQVCRDCRDLIRATNTNKLLLIFDLFQKIDVGAKVQTSERDHARLDMLEEVKRWCGRQLGPDNFAIVVISEIRKADGRRSDNTLRTDDLKGDGRMAGDADVIMLMWPSNKPGNSATSVPLTLRIAKGRDDVVRRDLALVFDHEIHRFREAETDLKPQAISSIAAADQDDFDALAE